MTAKTLNDIKILIVDDDEEDFFITSEYIKSIPGYTCTLDWCYKYDEALEHICRGGYDVYFADYRLGIKTGLDLIKDAVGNGCEKPIVLLTGKGNKQIDVEAMQAGASDYLIKSELSTEKLERCIRYTMDRAASLKALKVNERKFRSIFERSKDAVFLSDENLVFKDVNYATSELLGFQKEELLNLSLFELFVNAKEVPALQEKLLADGEVDDKELELFNRGRERKTCILSLTRELNENGTVYLQGILHDITNLKKAEKATLQTEKLGAAGRLVRTLAHEVRNPLNNINLSLEQLAPSLTDDQSVVYLDIINRNSKRIGALISELLNFSRQNEITLERRDLKTVLDESIAMAVDRITLHRIQLEVNYPEGELQILADTEKLKLAFLNIIINAIEAMAEDSGRLSVTVSRPDGKYEVAIADNGSGISEEHLTRLFEPYFTSKRNGLGLGLATTLHIIQSHKATVEVQSKIGEGSRFVLSFDRAN